MLKTHSMVLIALAILFCGRTGFSQTQVFTQPNSAMEPTILQGEKLSAEMQPFQPSRGDLVIFEHGVEHEAVLVVKRVIGIGGDVVEGRNLQIFLNGKIKDEPYVQHTGKRPFPVGFKTLETFGPVRVPAGKLFVAGDNRDFSLDSRDPSFGVVSVTDVRGRPIEIVDSPNLGRLHRSLRNASVVDDRDPQKTVADSFMANLVANRIGGAVDRMEPEFTAGLGRPEAEKAITRLF